MLRGSGGRALARLAGLAARRAEQQQHQSALAAAGACALSAASPSPSPSPSSAPQPHLHQHQRSMSLMYARKLDGRVYDLRNDLVENSFGSMAEYITKTCPKWVTMAVSSPSASSSDGKTEATLYTTPDALLPLCRFLRDHVHTQFKCLIDVTAVDFPDRPSRFEVVYHFLSPRWNQRLRVKVPVDELTPVPSLDRLFPAANWFEREAYDMFGVFFSGHPDLRRILTDYGFTGYPLRKDFPLTGYTEVRYDFSRKRVVSEPVELTQEFRAFAMLESPWETLPR
jgi:NADH dehydrogenase (ubiquinone) Fe-S protein 3